MSSGLHVEKNAKTQDVKSSLLAELDPELGSTPRLISKDHLTLVEEEQLFSQEEDTRIRRTEKMLETESQSEVKLAAFTEQAAQTTQETSALDSEKSGPRCTQDQLTITIQGIQHTLLVLSQDLKNLVSQKGQAQKAHARRERRRAKRASGAENQPPRFSEDSPLAQQYDASTSDIAERSQFPADHPQERACDESNGSKPAEGGSPVPIENWTPPESGKVGQNEPEISALVDDFEEPTTTQKQQEQPGTPQEPAKSVEIQRRDAKRMLRATKKIAYDLLRSTRDQANAKKPKPEKKNMIYVTLERDAQRVAYRN
jgi:hypothetical protein